MFPPSRHPIPYTTAAGRHGCCEGQERQHGAPGPKPDGRPPRMRRANSDDAGRTRAASDGEGAEKQHAKETGSSQPLRGTGSVGLHRAPVAEAPAGTADTGPWRSPTRHPGLLRTAPGENGLVAELPHREPLRNGSDGAAVTPAVAQPPALPGRQGTQGNPEMLLTTARRQLPAWPVQHQGKRFWPGGCHPGDRKTPRLSAGRNDVPTPRQP